MGEDFSAIEQALRQARQVGDGWDIPLPLGYGYQGGPVFPAHRLPAWLNSYCVELAEELQVPIDLPAMLALSVLGAAAGGRAVAEVRVNWREPLNLYTAVAMPPGARKTPVFMRMIRPLEDAEDAQADAARPDVTEARVRFASAKALADKAELDVARASQDAREEAVHYAATMRQIAEAIVVPVMPRLLADDATPETLTSLLHEQGGRLALFSDEGDVFNMMAGRYSTSGPNLAVYLKGHVGSPIRVDRKTRDSEVVKRPALTLGLTIQPDMLKAISTIPGARGRGLLGRFLWSVPASNIGGRETRSKAMSEACEKRYIDDVTLLVMSLRDWTDPAVLVFTPGATEAVYDYMDVLEKRMAPRADLGHIADWVSKLAGHMVRVAGLLHLASNVGGSWSQPVLASVVDDAVKIADYLIAHALIAFRAMAQDAVTDDAEAVLDWIGDRPSFTRREAYRSHQTRFGSVESIVPALTLLEEHGFIRKLPSEPTTARGRPMGLRYAVNPQHRDSGTLDTLTQMP